MNRSLMAGAALVAGIAIAAPLAARSQNQPPTGPAQEQAAPGQPQNMPGNRGMMGRQGMMGMMGMRGHEEMAEHMGPMWRHHWMREGMHRSPADRCENRLARRAAMIAYTITKLDLTPQQRPLWDKLNSTLQAGTQREQQLCNALRAGAQRGQPTILERVNRREQFLGAQLQTLQQARPELQQFYQSLSPGQQAIINHPFRRG